MTYELEFKPQAVKDLERLDATLRTRIVAKVEIMADGLRGDVMRLTNFTPEYRLRVGDYRVLFEIEGSKVVIYKVRHRSKSYR